MKTNVILIAWLPVVVLAGTFVAAEEASDPRPASQVYSSSRSLPAIQLDVRAALRAEALSRRDGPNVLEVTRLIELYLELADHPKRDQSAVARELGLQLRSRLRDVSEHIERRDLDGQRRTKTKGFVVSLIVPEVHVLAQQIAVPAGAPAGPGVQLAAVQNAAVPVGAAQAVDYGPELVDIIQRTISPTTWDISGGNASIVYFAPRHALVVRATGPAHRQIADLLGQLRRAP